MGNPVAWFEVLGPDGGALQRFYSELFGWQVDAGNEMQYGMVTAPEGGIGGGIAQSPDGAAQLTFYIAVPDLQAALDKAGQLGGKMAAPPMDVPGGPTIAYFTDPAGNRVGLMKTPD